jgi:MFS transporter, AAHS family, benzoate transport protein
MSTHLPRAAQTVGTSRAADFWPVLLCWVAVALDGYDLVVLGVVIPTLLESGALGFTGPTITTASTLGFGRHGHWRRLGRAADRPVRSAQEPYHQRRHVLALHNRDRPRAKRWPVHDLPFPGRLGLGGCLPTALAFMSEHAPTGRGGSAITRMMTGYHVGAVLSALLALWMVEDYGWRSMFVVGGALGLLTLPFMWAKLPESAAYLRAVERRDRSAAGTLARSADVVKGRYLRISIGLCVASFMGLLLVYGLNTWLPTIMRDAGYSIQQGTTLILVLNVGAVIGLLVAGHFSDTRGNKPAVLAWFTLAAVFLALLSIRMESRLLVYAAVLLTGIFVFSAQVLVYAFVGHLYPPEIRGTALGVAAGVGRVGAIVGPSLGGTLVTAGVAYPWGFYAFTLAAVLAVLTLATVPAHVNAVD